MTNANVRALPITGSSGAVRDAATIYQGFTFRETGGTNAAVIQLYDHASSATGTLLETIKLAAGESSRVMYASGVWAVNGVYLAKTGTGVVEGSVFIG